MYCEQTCRNTIGSFECSCTWGYTISSDNVSCISDKNNQGMSTRFETFLLFTIMSNTNLLLAEHSMINDRGSIDVSPCLNMPLIVMSFCSYTVGLLVSM